MARALPFDPAFCVPPRARILALSRRVPRSAPGRSFLIDDSTISRPPGDVLLASSREPWTDGRRRGARLVRRRAPGTYGPAAPGACPRTTTTNGVAGCYDGSAPGLRPRRAMMPFAARALLMYCEALRRQSTAVLTLPRSSRPSSPRCDSRSPSLCYALWVGPRSATGSRSTRARSWRCICPSRRVRTYACLVYEDLD